MTLEEWLRENVPLVRVSSAELRYERMERQAAEPLPWVHRPADPARPFDWVDACLIGAFLSALGDVKRVLDIGTGDGWPALPLARHVPTVVAVDASPKRCQVTRENTRLQGLANVEVACAPAERLPFPDRSFDGAVAGTAIEQCDDPALALREALRVLRPGGRLAATCEDLRAELKADVEEEAELYLEGDVAIYRLCHRSRAPLREAEYELRFHASAPIRRAASQVRPVPSFRAESTEPGLRLVAPDDEFLGIPFLSRARAELISARYFELRHRTPEEMTALAEDAGFTCVRAYGPITVLAAPFFLALSEAGLLPKLSPHMDEVTLAFGRLHPFVPPGKSSVFFLVGRKP